MFNPVNASYLNNHPKLKETGLIILHKLMQTDENSFEHSKTKQTKQWCNCCQVCQNIEKKEKFPPSKAVRIRRQTSLPHRMLKQSSNIQC